MPKKRKLNSNNPKYLGKVVEIKNNKKLIREIKGVKIYAVYSE